MEMDLQSIYPNISDETWDQELSNDHVEKLAVFVVDWENKLYPVMKEITDVNDIKFLCEDEQQSAALLRKWKKNCAKPTNRKIIEIFVESQDRECARELIKLLLVHDPEFQVNKSATQVSKVCSGPFISHPILMNNKMVRDKFHAARPEAIGGEMEGGALMKVMNEVNQIEGVIIIKGVVDYADGKKEKEWQLTSAMAAVSYAKSKLDADGRRTFYKEPNPNRIQYDSSGDSGNPGTEQPNPNHIRDEGSGIKRIEFNEKTVKDVLADVTEWERLGDGLEIPKRKLREIRLDFNAYGNNRQKSEMIDFWFVYDTNKCWEKLCIALEEMDENVLAKRIRKKYC